MCLISLIEFYNINQIQVLLANGYFLYMNIYLSEYNIQFKGSTESIKMQYIYSKMGFKT